MKVVVNLPFEEDDKNILEDKIATFHATLILETIEKLEFNNKKKKSILADTISKVKELNLNTQE